MNGYAIAIATLIIALAGPLALGMTGMLRSRSGSSGSDAALPWNWVLTLRSTLLYTLAFNLTFSIQELFLVLPKAFTPGVRPTLFHNDHRWEGMHPLVPLFQGTGVAATMLMSMACLWMLKRCATASTNTRLFLIWMVYCGMLMALPQFAIGALSSGSDVGMAMNYFGLDNRIRLVAGLVALAAIPSVALRLTRPLLALAERPERIGDAGARTRFVFLVAMLPALVGATLSIPFRVPREWIEVVLLPAWVAILGTVWMPAGAWRVDDVQASGAASGSMMIPLVSVTLVLLVFQLVLRPGIAFY